MKNSSAIFVFLLSSLSCWAALPVATTIREVEVTTGNNNNPGCFISGSSGTDRSQGAVFTAFTDLVIGGTTTQVTSVAHPFGATDVGNCIRVVSGAGCTVGIFYVVSVSVVTATLDRSAGTAASTCTANLGGAIATLAQLNTDMIGGNTAWVKAEATYSVSAGITWNFTQGAVAGSINGYTSTRGDNGFVTVQASAGGFDIFALNVGNDQMIMRNFILDCNAKATCNGVRYTNAGMTMENLKVLGPTGTFGVLFNNVRSTCRWCYVSTGTGSVNAFSLSTDTMCFVCVATGNTATAFVSIGTCIWCIAANNTGASTDGFSSSDSQSPRQCMYCIAYANGRDGFRYSGASVAYGFSFINSVFVSNGGFGINFTAYTVPAYGETFDYNAFFNNTSGAVSGITAGSHDITLAGDPFTNGAGNVFTTNTTVGRGAALRAAGYPGAFVIGGTSAPDIGALQSAASSSVTVGVPIQ